MDIVAQSTESRSINEGLKCKSCQSSQQQVFRGKGPHVAALRCKSCGHFFKWVSRLDCDRLGIVPEELNEYSEPTLFGGWE